MTGMDSVRLDDAEDRVWHLVDKVPGFGLDLNPRRGCRCPGQLLCDVVDEDGGLAVVAPRWGIEAEDGTNRFRVLHDQLVAEDA